MKFSPVHISAFKAASHDLNPLHLDADYARRSQFGRPVVYGMAGVLHGLGAWANGRHFRLRSLRAIFRKAMFEGEEYHIAISEADGQVTLKYQRGPVDYAVITFEAVLADQGFVEAGRLYAPFLPLTASNAVPNDSGQQVSYLMNDNWPQVREAFGLERDTMPPHQLAFLCWASYHVGMVLPGRQALFSELQVAFTDEDMRSRAVNLTLDAAECDDRFNRYVITGSGAGVESLRIAAFKRPEPVDFPLGGMPAFAGGFLPLLDQVVFISGATRGFGAAMARVCALAGARVLINFRGDAQAAETLALELKAAGHDATMLAGDMSDPNAVAFMASSIAKTHGRIDLIVNNAAPPIRDLQFLEQDNAHLQQFVQTNLAITLETARQFLPLMGKGGRFLHISTKYLVEPVRGFSHYLTAKAAQEALVQALALEFREQEFIVARLPRILTDQTNLAFDFDPPLHPGEVARDAILAIMEPNPKDNFRIVELFERED